MTGGKTMEKLLATTLMILSLIVGVIGGAVFFTEDAVACPAEKVCPSCPVVEQVVCEQDTTPNDILNTTIDDVLNYLEDEEELVCDSDDYDLNEVDVSKVYDDFTIEYDDDQLEVKGKMTLNFKMDEEKRCRDTIRFKVVYEDDEEPVITTN